MQKRHLTIQKLKFQLLVIKALNKMEDRKEFPQPDTTIYETLTGNIILSGERLKAFFLRLRSGARQGRPLSPLVFHITLEVLPRTRQDK